MDHTDRLSQYATVSTALALLGDRRLADLAAAAQSLGSGIGGTSGLTEIDGVPVFVKRIPLTDLELRPEHLRSTANLFGLPAYCQYGVGGPGFGAWRELAANTMTTNWVLTGRTGAFPLLYGWRVLPGAAPVAAEHVDAEEAVAYWGGSPAVRARLDAVARATSSLVLFLEHVPWNLDEWLAAQLAAGADAVAEACALLARELPAGVAVMNANGLLHFDAHFGNILTDGRRLYFADLGLATSPRFELSAEEREFGDRHADHDHGYVVMRLANWLVTNVCGVPSAATGGPVERNEYLRTCARDGVPGSVPAAAAAILARYAPVAVVMNDFYWDVFGTSRATPFPAERLRRARAAN